MPGEPALLSAFQSIMMMAIWSSVGNYMVIFLAGLQDIPSELYESAEVDGYFIRGIATTGIR